MLPGTRQTYKATEICCHHRIPETPVLLIHTHEVGINDNDSKVQVVCTVYTVTIVLHTQCTHTFKESHRNLVVS